MRFWRVLLLIVLAALAFRVGYVLVTKHDEPQQGDQIYYNVAANQLARGKWFTDPRDGSQTAQHPPLTALALAPMSWVTSSSTKMATTCSRNGSRWPSSAAAWSC